MSVDSAVKGRIPIIFVASRYWSAIFFEMTSGLFPPDTRSPVPMIYSSLFPIFSFLYVYDDPLNSASNVSSSVALLILRLTISPDMPDLGSDARGAVWTACVGACCCWVLLSCSTLLVTPLGVISELRVSSRLLFPYTLTT